MKKVADQFGRLYILVNNAGVFVMGAVNDPATGTDALAREFAVNVVGVAAAVRTAVQHMSEGGRIISIGSVVGEASPLAGIADYSATKPLCSDIRAAGPGTSDRRGSRSNTVQPGPIDTDMNPAEGTFSDAQKSRTPLGRYG